MTAPADGPRMHMLFGPDGMPSGMLNVDRITDAGTRLAFGLTAVSEDPAAVDVIIRMALERYGADEFAYVAASALSVVVRHVVAPCAEPVLAAAGRDIRADAARVLDGFDGQSCTDAD